MEEPFGERDQPLYAGFCPPCQALFTPAVTCVPTCGATMLGVLFAGVSRGAVTDAGGSDLMEIAIPDAGQHAALIADLLLRTAVMA